MRQSIAVMPGKPIHAEKRGLARAVSKYKLYYVLVVPGLLYFLIFYYVPMFGIVISFKDYAPFEGVRGIFTSKWVGFQYYSMFFHSYYFWNILRNTVLISFYGLLVGFPLPIAYALLLNEVRNMAFKKITQTLSYLPHFISIVVVAGMLMSFLSTQGGVFNEIIKLLGGEPIFFLGNAGYFRSIVVLSGVWQEMGWSSIIYLAAISGVDPQLYESAIIDGAGKWRQVWNITLPSISHIIVILLIFSIGGLLSVNFEKILLLYSPAVYEVGDVIDTYVYREGLLSMKYSYATAVGLFRSVISLALMLGVNFAAKKLGQEGIW